MIRFWSKVDIRGPNECWPWKAYRTKKGYGRFSFNGRKDHKVVRANRCAFFLTHGYWPENGLHTCDNPPCCNPAHVYDGTPKQNTADMLSRGRARGRYSK
jgi:hypothetical protein